MILVSPRTTTLTIATETDTGINSIDDIILCNIYIYIIMRKIYLHSSRAKNNIFSLDKSIEGMYKLVGFSFTNNIYNINDTNNKIYINENGTDYVGVLTNGFYYPSDLVSECEDAMNEVCVGAVTVTKDSKTHKLTITDTLPFYFTFGSNTSSSARKLLGFNESDGSNSTTHVSDVSIDLNTYKSFFINITDNDDRNLYSVDHFRTSFLMSGLSNFSEVYRYVPLDNFEQCVKFSRGVKRLEIKFHDLNNEDVELNSEYEILLEEMKC